MPAAASALAGNLPSPPQAALASSPRARLLRAATELFCRRGINAVGVDAVVEAAGTAKTTLYKTFGSKERLVEAVLEAEGRAWRDWFLTGLDTGAGSSSDRLRRIFPLLRAWFTTERFYGCPFINAVGEHDKADDRLRRLALEHKKAVLARIEVLARTAGADDPLLLTHQIGLLIDGAIVAAMVARDPAVAGFAALALDGLLAASVVGTAGRAAETAA